MNPRNALHLRIRQNRHRRVRERAVKTRLDHLVIGRHRENAHRRRRAGHRRPPRWSAGEPFWATAWSTLSRELHATLLAPG
jgi:hypothetical protein